MASSYCNDDGWRKGPWTPQEDNLLLNYISLNGEGRWSSVSKSTGLKRNGKSCRLRWVNYLRPGLKKEHLTPQEEATIIELHALWGNKWSTIARYLPGRTDNEIKNYWRTHFKTKRKGCDEAKEEKGKMLEGVERGGKNVGEMEFAGVMENDDEVVPMPMPMVDDDFIPFDCYLWGGLWNLQDDLNQPNYIQGDHALHYGDFLF